MPIETESRREPHRFSDGDRGVSRSSDLSINDLDIGEFRSFSPNQNLRMLSEHLPRVEIVDGQPARTNIYDTPESSLRRRIASDYASPAMAERGARFSRDMVTFAERARAAGISENEVAETYRHVGRILDGGPNGRLSHEQRLVLASQVIHNAAFPTQIRQNENTCNVTTLEVRTYLRQPSAAAALIADVVTRGSFTGHDGTTVRLDNRSLTPSVLGTTNLDEEPSRRSFASQIFQVTAANIANINDRDFRNLRYEQRPPQRRGDFGEALVDVRTGRVVEREPGAAGRPNGLIAANESITGRRDESDAFLVNRERQGRTSTRAGVFNSAEELGQSLERLTRAGRMPVVIFVHANSELLTPQRPGETPQGRAEIPQNLFDDGHFVTITGYDPVARTVRYDDQYGPESDRNDRPVSLETFYRATHVLRANELLDRLARARTTMTHDEYARTLGQIARSYGERWRIVESAGGFANSQDVRADRESAGRRISDLSHELPPAHRLRLQATMNARPSARER